MLAAVHLLTVSADKTRQAVTDIAGRRLEVIRRDGAPPAVAMLRRQRPSADAIRPSIPRRDRRLAAQTILAPVPHAEQLTTREASPNRFRAANVTHHIHG